MIELNGLRVGDRLKDNDPRMGSRYLRVTQIGISVVDAEHPISKRVFTIAQSRIYTDGKPRRSGFSLLRDAV